MTEDERPQLREKWLFIGNVPLLYQTENMTKQMTVEIMFTEKNKPMVVRGIEGAETILDALKGKVIMTPEQIKRDREAIRGYLV